MGNDVRSPDQDYKMIIGQWCPKEKNVAEKKSVTIEKAALTLIPFGTEDQAIKIQDGNGKGLSGSLFKGVSQQAVITSPKGTKFETTLNTGLVIDCPELFKAFEKSKVTEGTAIGPFTVTLTECPKVKKTKKGGSSIAMDDAGF